MLEFRNHIGILPPCGSGSKSRSPFCWSLLLAQHNLEEVRMVLYTREDEKAYTIYAQALAELLGTDVDGRT